ncbi:two-component system sensor histidine kinase NtrB [Thiovibrio sp. JS02]
MLKSLCPRTGSPAANDHLKKQIQWLLFLRVLFLSLMLGSSVLLQSEGSAILLPAIHYITYFIAGLYLFTIASALLLRKISCYSRFGYLQILVDTLLVTLLVFFTGGSQSVFSVVYFFPIVMGAFMLFRQGGMLFAVITTLTYGGLLLVEYHGLVPRYLPPEATPLLNMQVVLHYFAIHGLTFFLVAILSTMLSARLQKAEAQLFQTASDYDRLSFLYKQIFDDINTGIITIGANNRITSFNHAAEVITGYSAGEAIGEDISVRFPDLTQSPQENSRPMAMLTKKDGETIPVGYSWAKLNTPDDCDDCKVYTLQDLSQIKKMEAKVQQSAKMATIGEMAAGIAHELRNPLAAISGAAQLLEKDFNELSANRRLFNIIIRECDRLEETIHEFLLFSKPVIPEKEWFSLRDLANEAMETLSQNPAWNEDLTVFVDIPASLECWADPQLVRQVLLNLLTNSANACRRTTAGRIVIRAEEKSMPGAVHGEEAIILQVEDNGHGIPDAIREKIFAPFFTTRENGTGLGLAIVRQIVESHGGRIDYTPLAPQGVRFRVSLPLP